MTLILKAHQNRQRAIQSIRAREVNLFADDFAQNRRPRPQNRQRAGSGI